MEIFLTFDKVHDHSLGLHVQKISDQATPNCQFPFLLILLRTAKFYSKFTFLNLIAGLCIFLLPLALIEFTILEAELLAVGFFF